MQQDSLYFSKIDKEVIQATLDTNISIGLTKDQVIEKQRVHGLNELSIKPPISKIRILIRQLKSIIVVLLFIACLSSFLMGEVVEGLTIVAVLLINTALGFFTELKAVRSMEALKKIGITNSSVIREGKAYAIETRQLVPGDLILFEAGDILGADIRIIESNNLSINESILTGESAPVDKTDKPLLEDTIVAERSNIIFKATAVTRGSGKGIVIATAMDTEVGKIARFTQQEKEEITPLEKRLDKLGGQIVWFSLGIALIIAISGYLSGKELILMIETAIALAIATIPEGLPIVATLALAKGMWAMAENKALINKLAAVETLGATSIIFTDKTGTLTENKMQVRAIKLSNRNYDMSKAHDLENHKSLKKIIKIGLLCNNSEININNPEKSIGDPMEMALLSVANNYGLDRDLELSKLPELKEVPFDGQTLMMATYHQDIDQILVAVKGAPEAVIESVTKVLIENEIVELTNEAKEIWLKENENLAREGLRIIAMAYKNVKEIGEAPYNDLILIGLVGLLDPARSDVKDAILKSKAAGIKTIMVTGDQEGTALNIAKEIQLIQEDNNLSINGRELGAREDWNKILKEKINHTQVFSRVNPKQKLDLIEYFQDKNAVVAMTGDGVNDAPALKNADIGIAMGLRGTQIAKEASDMVLQDDRFNTIILAIKQGRIIYSNIQRFVVYLLSCNISEILIVSIATLMNAPLPLLPLQILFLNLVTDVFPALALGMGEGDETYLEKSPRPRDEQIITKRKWALIITYGIILTLSVLGGFFYILKTTNDEKSALTVSFLSLAFAQVFHVFNMRLERSNFFNNEITRNIHVWGAVILCTVILVCAVFIPGLRQILSLKLISTDSWLVVIYSSLAPLLIIQLLSKFKLGIRI